LNDCICDCAWPDVGFTLIIIRWKLVSIQHFSSIHYLILMANGRTADCW
jgi:hypothetical protein